MSRTALGRRLEHRRICACGRKKSWGATLCAICYSNPVRRFWLKVEPEPNSGCWLWMGAISNRMGHGRFAPTRRTLVYAHRFSYELHREPIPRGFVLDHLCRVPQCVNPVHLESVTPGENARRIPEALKSRPARRDICPRGHPYRRDESGHARCRICHRSEQQSYKERCRGV